MIGDNIRRIMSEKGLTQAHVAHMAKISQSTLSNIINGISQPYNDTLLNIANALGVAVCDLKASEQLAQKLTCSRCGSHVVIEWHNHDKDTYRIRCEYCEADTGEQNSRAKAVAVFHNLKKPQKWSQTQLHVLPLEELLDFGEYDNDSMRPLWLENRGLFLVASIIQYGTAEQQTGIVRAQWHSSFGEKSFVLNQYGSWWRCWNAKPSQAVAESTPWDDGK